MKPLTDSSKKVLFDAVNEYKKTATSELDSETFRKSVLLLKEINNRLPGRNLLLASLTDLNHIGREMITEGKPAEDVKLLKEQLLKLYDIAMEKGFISYHPLRKKARITEKQTAAERSIPRSASPVTSQAANIVTGIMEESLQRGLLLSPLSLPVAEVFEKQEAVDNFVSGLSGRWRVAAHRFKWLLEGFRIAIPLFALIFALHAWFGEENPFFRLQNTAFSTQNALQDLKIAAALLETEYAPSRRFTDLVDFGDRVGVDMERASNVFTLLKVVPEASLIYLRHNETGTTVVVGSETLYKIKNGHTEVLR